MQSVVDEASRLAREDGEAGSLTLGALYRHWDNAAQFLFHVVTGMLLPKDGSPTQEMKALLGRLTTAVRSGAPVEEAYAVLAETAVADLTNAAGIDDDRLSRLWFMCVARSNEPATRDLLDSVYAGFDEMMIPIYELLLALTGRVVREEFGGSTPEGSKNLAAALTAVTEGAAVRVVARDGGHEIPFLRPENPMVAAMWRGVWDELTTPSQPQAELRNTESPELTRVAGVRERPRRSSE